MQTPENCGPRRIVTRTKKTTDKCCCTIYGHAPRPVVHRVLSMVSTDRFSTLHYTWKIVLRFSCPGAQSEGYLRPFSNFRNHTSCSNIDFSGQWLTFFGYQKWTKSNVDIFLVQKRAKYDIFCPLKESNWFKIFFWSKKSALKIIKLARRICMAVQCS